MELLIKAGGIYHIVLAIFHLLFRRIFNWNEDLRALSSLNRAIMPVLNLSLTLVFAMFGYLSLMHAEALLSTPLGHTLLVLIAMFWFVRALLQPVFFGLQHPGSIAFMLFFLAGAVIYILPAVNAA